MDRPAINLEEERLSYQMSVHELQSEITRRRVSSISNTRFIINLIIIGILWTSSSFISYMLSFMNKYFEGSLFLNYYLDGLSGIVGSIISTSTYNCFGMRYSFVFSVLITLIGGIFLLVFQQGYLSPHFMYKFGFGDSGYERDSPQDREYYLQYLIPIIVFITKVGNNITF